MKKIFHKILILPILFAAFVPNFYAQTANNSQPLKTNTEILGENERLPFMQNEQNSALEEPSSGGLLLKTFGALLLIVGLIFFGAWAAKKFGIGGLNSIDSPQDLSILSSIQLGTGRTISTVRFGGRVLLIGSTAQSFTLLAEEAGDAKESFQNSRSVAEMLAEEPNSFTDEFEQAQAKLGVYDRKGEQF